MDNTVPAVDGDPIFRFDAADHSYTDENGEEIPHITGLLMRGGYIDETWFTEESSTRGTHVHKLTADYDLGALDPKRCVSPYRPYLLAHVAAMRIARPVILAVEEPIVDPVLRFGGRPDRELIMYGLHGVLDGKTGAPAKMVDGVTAHGVQTALQAILCARRAKLPAERLARWLLYWQKNGKFKLEEQINPRDWHVARELIAKYAGVA